MATKLSQAASPRFGDVIANRREVATVLWQLPIMKSVAPDLAIDRRAMPTDLACHLVDRHLALDQVMKTPSIGEGQLRIASGHAKISKVKPLKSLACRT
ncbi:hypothetical protein FHX12_005700 [Rhizobium sp. BK609]|nr:hypothetical protein [Rhizobium sp. BK098]MBB3618678.1 hypothetical protein [Rhizobium sp. BK609]MBB3684360.1 hypothetical protein [Rhizobium sp. BK612]